MKTPASQLRIAFILLGVIGLVVLAGCWKTSGNRSITSQPPKNATPPAGANLSEQARQTVTGYLEALGKLDFATAYDFLSKASQSKHSRASFEEQGKKGMPQYDLQSSQTTVHGDQATVTLNLAEEPGQHEFNLVREDGAWKIVFDGGGPGQPYPVNTAGEHE